MYYEDESGRTNFVAGLLVGAVMGAGIALLMAPQSGKTTRTRLIRRVRAPRNGSNAGNVDRDEIVRDLKRRRRKARNRSTT